MIAIISQDLISTKDVNLRLRATRGETDRRLRSQAN